MYRGRFKGLIGKWWAWVKDYRTLRHVYVLDMEPFAPASRYFKVYVLESDGFKDEYNMRRDQLRAVIAESDKKQNELNRKFIKSWFKQQG